MFDFHSDKSTYFKYQYRTAKEYIIPFLEESFELKTDFKVLEIGCAEAGVLKAFLERGHQCVGIELMESRVKLAEEFLKDEVKAGDVRFIAKNIYDIDIQKDIGHKFDLVILKDVIEHIHNQELFIGKLKDFLTPNGKIFFGFPPWQMPFGGHQQKCKSKLLSMLPYYHLLPMGVYKGVMKVFGETETKIENMAEIKETGISIERFERIFKEEDYAQLRRQLFLINPIYKYKFNLKPRPQFRFFSSIPVFRNFVSTCAYYVIEV
ncbi:MAG: methyltransferase domain-containing protein [Balneolaceae bacterium]|nr:methyltransferase domain-containing protein [Balneolaceae bacterium]MBO6546871.1 methyltransferase domain-containing protein [Balneolaceae bacterium]MBO6649231.1 methyltransferase domain-containing protein [Balneolaceae bacterium]